jgi:hypothetical protein
MAENKTIRWVQTQFIRLFAANISNTEHVRILQKALRDRIRLRLASKNKPEAKLWAGVYRMHLYRFGQGWAVGQGYQVGQRYEQGGFMGKMKSGHKGIFRRLSFKRLPIAELSVPLKLSAWQAIEPIMDAAETRLQRELKQAIKYLISKRSLTA